MATAPAIPLAAAPMVPAHVPAHLVGSFDIHNAPEMAQDPFAFVSRLHAGPDIFWSTDTMRDGTGDGCWVVTRGELMREILGDPSRFSSKGEAGFSKLIGEDWDMIPLEIDPPMHTAFREILNPILYPRVVARMTEGVVQRANDLIDQFADKDGCEFMSSFGTPFPISIFMQLMGLPQEWMSVFLVWEEDLLRGATPARRVAAAKAIRLYLDTLADERRANPKDDLASLVVTSKIDGRLWTDKEVIGALYLFFVGGLDTVASSLGWFFDFLARNPEKQQWLRDNPQEIPHAVEELVRRFSVVTSRRRCTRDLDFHGVQMKQGDWISLTYSAGSLDPSAFDNPLEVDFHRKGVRHFGFSFGPHFCIGTHLARREMAVALRLWLSRIPPFRIREGSQVARHGGGVFGISHLELAWD
ncbi:cytochrome P450 [Sphingobium sp. Sx8-8]|uniref:cytochrome P450 n=1 Tax=Sphingobium sp. Sx8-8 TaxID=2933617 RepID=UPI001F5688C8|nr:cytochrome P450 [Sphingobium sp. Sx8-8]